MLLNPTIALLLASLAAAAPASIESQPKQDDISVWLNAHIFAVSKYVEPSTDAVAVAVDDDFLQYYISSVMVSCVNKCDQDYHCHLYDENLDVFMTVLPGTTRLQPPQKVYQVSCKAGIPSPGETDPAFGITPPELPRSES